MSLDCSFEEFKRMAKEFHEAAPTMCLEELENAWKCLGLGYLGMHETRWQNSAATVLKMEARTFAEREGDLTYNAKLTGLAPGKDEQ